jgi:hypothetical protein
MNFLSKTMLAVIIVIMFGWLCISKAHGNQMLMVDQNGNIVPSGYTAGLDEIAEAEAQAVAAQQAADLITQTTAAASNIVDEITTALTGSIGICYVTGHTISFDTAVIVNSNATAYIVYFQPLAAGTMTTNGTSYSGHYVWHVYSSAVNSTPLIKYKSNLNATNGWQFADYQSTSEYHNATVNGTTYAVIYRSTVWLPSSYDAAFFEAFVESTGGGSAGDLFDVVDGISIGGKVGFTGTIERNGKFYTYHTGILMSVLENQE